MPSNYTSGFARVTCNHAYRCWLFMLLHVLSLQLALFGFEHTYLQPHGFKRTPTCWQVLFVCLSQQILLSPAAVSMKSVVTRWQKGQALLHTDTIWNWRHT
jgi:hypothetical protein